jgi:flagellar export protein FliJ
MKGLDTLARLAKFELDAARRQLAGLEQLRDHFQLGLQRLASDLGREQALAAESWEAGRSYAAYARAMIQRRSVMQKSLDDLAPRLAEAADVVTEAYQTLKRYELAIEHRQRLAAAQAQRREQAALDATALSRFQRARGTG